MAERETCRGTNAEGEPCTSPFTGPDGWFDAHRPGNEGEMAERGRRGAEVANSRRRHADDLQPEELPELESHEDAKLWLDTLGRAVATGWIERREADSAIRAVQAWVSTHEGALAEEKLAALQERIAQLEKQRVPAVS